MIPRMQSENLRLKVSIPFLIDIEMKMETEKFLPFVDFFNIEKSVTDRYKFVKIFMRKYYEQYVKLPRDKIDEINEQVKYQTNSTHSMQTLPDELALNITSGTKSRFGIFNKIRDKFF
jgi:predicted nucleic acid-binding OB-fold protein